MIKFLKYELKRSKIYLAFISLFAAFFSIIINFVNIFNKDYNFSLLISFYTSLTIILLICLIYFVNRYRKDIFSKSSYFTFTINLSTNKIIFAKFLTGLVITFVSLVEFLVFFIIGNLIFGLNNAYLTSFNIFVIISLLIYWAISFILLLLGVSLSRVKFFNRYYEFVTIVLSVVVNVLVLWLMKNLYSLNTTMIDLRDFAIRKISNINGIDIFMVYYDINEKVLGINLRMLLVAIFVIVFGFFLNSYLIEEKIDL